MKNGGGIRLGQRLRFDGKIVPIDLACERGAELTIGDGTYVNYGTSIGSSKSIRIGRECAIGQYSIIIDSDYHAPGDIWRLGEPSPITIGDGVWLGARVVVLKGSDIGDGAVIGANSVVRGHIPPRTLAAGTPAKVLKRLDPPPGAEKDP